MIWCYCVWLQELNDEIHQEQMREMALLNAGGDDLVPAAQGPIAVQGTYVRGRPRGRGVVTVGRPGAGRSVLAGSMRPHRLQPQRAHLQVAVSAARSAAGLPRSPTVAHAAPRTVQPQVGDPYAVCILHLAAHFTSRGFLVPITFPVNSWPILNSPIRAWSYDQNSSYCD